MKRPAIGLAVLVALVPGLPACDSPTEPEPTEFDIMMEATERYVNVDAATADGFVPLSPCVASPAGAMGFHYGLPARLQDAVVDPAEPEVLLYAPAAGGGLRLVGVEFMVHQDAWTAAGNTDAPSIAGQTFEPPNPNHPDEMIRPFHTLHAWIWEENPEGMFVPFNPQVSCD